MGYLFLLPTFIFSLLKGYSGKKTSGLVTDYKSAFLVSLLRIFFCVILGGILIIPEILQSGIVFLKIPAPVLVTSAFSGLTNAAVLVLWILLIKKGALVLIDSSSMCGVVLPLTLSMIFYNEVIKINHIIGVALLIIAVFILSTYNSSVKQKLTPTTILLLILFGVSSGLADFSQKMFSKIAGEKVTASIFNLYTYIFAFVFLGAIYLITESFKKSRNSPFNLVAKSTGYVLIMAICLYLTSFFKTIASKYLLAAHIYPLYFGAMLILNGIMGAVFFGEKITKKSVIAVIISIVGIITINLI